MLAEPPPSEPLPAPASPPSPWPSPSLPWPPAPPSLPWLPPLPELTGGGIGASGPTSPASHASLHTVTELILPKPGYPGGLGSTHATSPSQHAMPGSGGAAYCIMSAPSAVHFGGHSTASPRPNVGLAAVVGASCCGGMATCVVGMARHCPTQRISARRDMAALRCAFACQIWRLLASFGGSKIQPVSQIQGGFDPGCRGRAEASLYFHPMTESFLANS